MKKTNIFRVFVIVGLVSMGLSAWAIETFEVETKDTHGGWNFYYFCGASDEIRMESARFRLDHLANEECRPDLAEHLETTFFDYNCTEIFPEGIGTYEATISGVYHCEQ